MRISVIIPNYNGERFLGACLDSLLAQTRNPGRVIVVDNGSNDSSRELARDHALGPELISLDRNHGFAYATNRGLEATDSEVVALLNNDAVADPRWVEFGLLAVDRYPEVSVFSSLMLQYHDHDRVDSAGDLYLEDGRPRPRGRGEPASGYGRPVEVFSACAGAAFYRRSLFDELGGFEESFFAYLEDVDLGFRARARGHICLFWPEAVVYHRGARTELGDHPGRKAVDSGERVRWIARNRVRVIARNWPLHYVVRWLPWLMIGLVRSAGYHSFVSGQKRAFFQGIIQGVKLIPSDREFFQKQSAHNAYSAIDSRKSSSARGSFQDIAEMIREGVRSWEP